VGALAGAARHRLGTQSERCEHAFLPACTGQVYEYTSPAIHESMGNPEYMESFYEQSSISLRSVGVQAGTYCLKTRTL
jgi:hypothetical protein